MCSQGKRTLERQHFENRAGRSQLSPGTSSGTERPFASTWTAPSSASDDDLIPIRSIGSPPTSPSARAMTRTCGRLRSSTNVVWRSQR
jgi:hypothetical protein